MGGVGSAEKIQGALQPGDYVAEVRSFSYDARKPPQPLLNGGSFTHSGESQCYDYGSVSSAIAWCHSVMMAEPYPGQWNHIANILDPNFTRVGFGYAVKSNGEVIMTWDFAG